jgi:nucleoside-diphosphate-sugar epimerase
MIVVTGTTGNVGKVLVQALARAGPKCSGTCRKRL